MKKRPLSRSRLEQLLTRLKRLFERKPEPEPEDPFVGVRSPNKRGPRNRSGAVALAEPNEDEEGHSFPRRVG